MNDAERHDFQAEIKQLLDIVIHSLYTDKEIFIRELISNAADALEKARFLQSSGEPLDQADLPLKISVTVDKDAHTIAIEDTGVGMTREELTENLGTIAHSGSKAFIQRLKDEQKQGANLIGQFGVGFYSVFMAADKVEVFSKSAKADSQPWLWVSEGAAGYSLTQTESRPRGTRIVAHLREDSHSFADDGQVEAVIRRYSNFVPFPIELNGKPVNTVQALWTRNKNEIKEEEYTEFYKYIGHDQTPPLFRLHFNADAPLAIQSLLFVPEKNWESMGLARSESEVNLYCRKILIKSHAKELFPDWLRFLKGVVDSEDLPLSISRESMQDSALLQKLSRTLTHKFLKFLEEQAEKNPEAYAKFYAEYHRFLKEGVTTEFAHREVLSKLLRYESSTLDKGQTTSLADYVKRMNSDQKEIYYILASNREAAETSPYFEVFRQKNVEALFMYDPWDEFVMERMGDFDGKAMKSVEKAELQLDQPEEGEKLSDADAADLAKWWKEQLGDRIREVRPSKRLVNSPAIALDSDPSMTSTMRRIMRGMNKEAAPATFSHDLEFNPRSALIVKLQASRSQNAELAAKVAEQIYDSARISAGLLEDPREMLTRMNELLEQTLSAKS